MIRDRVIFLRLHPLRSHVSAHHRVGGGLVPLGVLIFARIHVPFGHAIDTFFEGDPWGVPDREQFVGLELGF